MAGGLCIQSVTLTPNPIQTGGKFKIAVEIYALYPSASTFPGADTYPCNDPYKIPGSYPGSSTYAGSELLPGADIIL